MILGVATTTPNALKVSYNSCKASSLTSVLGEWHAKTIRQRSHADILSRGMESVRPGKSCLQDGMTHSGSASMFMGWATTTDLPPEAIRHLASTWIQAHLI